MAISNIFQKRISEFVDDSELAPAELTRRIDIDPRAFMLALQYGIIPTPRILIRIADYFKTSVAYLLGTTNEEIFYPADTASDFFLRIQQLCSEKNVSYYRVAKQCHFDKGYISRWIKQKYFPSWELLDILADYFKVSLDYLLGRTDERD
ncbi:MAG: helix-turn-helix transcriptional regulator [Clostridia bacterium]|nr:helix-turn-helix transcriptional regulator [Clostridia bacterium]